MLRRTLRKVIGARSAGMIGGNLAAPALSVASASIFTRYLSSSSGAAWSSSTQVGGEAVDRTEEEGRVTDDPRGDAAAFGEADRDGEEDDDGDFEGDDGEEDYDGTRGEYRKSPYSHLFDEDGAPVAAGAQYQDDTGTLKAREWERWDPHSFVVDTPHETLAADLVREQHVEVQELYEGHVERVMAWLKRTTEMAERQGTLGVPRGARWLCSELERAFKNVQLLDHTLHDTWVDPESRGLYWHVSMAIPERNIVLTSRYVGALVSVDPPPDTAEDRELADAAVANPDVADLITKRLSARAAVEGVGGTGGIRASTIPFARTRGERVFAAMDGGEAAGEELIGGRLATPFQAGDVVYGSETYGWEAPVRNRVRGPEGGLVTEESEWVIGFSRWLAPNEAEMRSGNHLALPEDEAEHGTIATVVETVNNGRLEPILGLRTGRIGQILELDPALDGWLVRTMIHLLTPPNPMLARWIEHKPWWSPSHVLESTQGVMYPSPLAPLLSPPATPADADAVGWGGFVRAKHVFFSPTLSPIRDPPESIEEAEASGWWWGGRHEPQGGRYSALDGWHEKWLADRAAVARAGEQARAWEEKQMLAAAEKLRLEREAAAASAASAAAMSGAALGGAVDEFGYSIGDVGSEGDDDIEDDWVWEDGMPPSGGMNE